jgi:hypothetical protein
VKKSIERGFRMKQYKILSSFGKIITWAKSEKEALKKYNLKKSDVIKIECIAFTTKIK